MDYKMKIKNKIPVLAAICLILVIGVLCLL